MRYIGNIISKEKVTTFSDFIYLTDKIDENTDLSLPTLIVGWEETRCFYPNASIIEHDITETVSWTHSPSFRRNEFEEAMSYFKRKVMKYITKHINYEYFKVFDASVTDIKKIILYLRRKKARILVSNDMLYLIRKEKIVGFCMNDAEYMGIDKHKVGNLVKGNTLIFTNSFLSEKDKKVFGYSAIMSAYLYSLTL